MSTFMANKANIERKWYILDAAGKPLGKTAVRAADLLRGKTKPTFTPNADCVDYVIIINAGKAVLTGKKQPELAMKVAVRGMLPKNTIGKESLKRLHIYADANYEQQAQKPVALDAE